MQGAIIVNNILIKTQLLSHKVSYKNVLMHFRQPLLLDIFNNDSKDSAPSSSG